MANSRSGPGSKQDKHMAMPESGESSEGMPPTPTEHGGHLKELQSDKAGIINKVVLGSDSKYNINIHESILT